MVVSFKGAHFPQDIILLCVHWYVAYPLSTRHIEELMLERGIHVDHSTVNRWVIKYSPQLEEAFHRRKRPVWVSWRMDETYIKVKGDFSKRISLMTMLKPVGLKCPTWAAQGGAPNAFRPPALRACPEQSPFDRPCG